jgi:hypothetical protein
MCRGPGNVQLLSSRVVLDSPRKDVGFLSDHYGVEAVFKFL